MPNDSADAGPLTLVFLSSKTAHPLTLDVARIQWAAMGALDRSVASILESTVKGYLSS